METRGTELDAMFPSSPGDEVALVTGGAGFIGSHLTKVLVERGIETVVLDDLSGGVERNVPSGALFIRGSILNHELVEHIIAHYGVTRVFHLAAYAAEGLSHFIRHYNYLNNIIGSVNLINSAVRNDVRCFVFTSSIAVYGHQPPPMRESMHPQPADPYGIAKTAVEQDLAAAFQMWGMPYVVFRPHNVYGEHQNTGDKYRNVIGIFMNQILKKEPMTLFGDGTQTRAFTHVSDVAPLMAAAGFYEPCWGKILNIGAETSYAVTDLARAVAEAMGVPDHPTVHLEARNEVVHAFASHEALRDILGKGSEVPLDIGWSRMAEWVRAEGPQSTKPFTGIEIDKGLPTSWTSEGWV